MHRNRSDDPQFENLRRIGRLLPIAALLLFSPGPVSASDASDAEGEASGESGQLAPPDYEAQWRPEFALGFLLHVQDLEGAASSNFVPLGKSTSDQAISPGFRLNAGLSTPVLMKSTPLKPRLFFQVGGQYLLEDSFTAFRGFSEDNNSYSAGKPIEPYDSTQTKIPWSCDAPQYQTNVKTDYPEVPIQLPELYNSALYDQTTIIQGPKDVFGQNTPNPAVTEIVLGAGGYGIGNIACTSRARATTSIDVMWTLEAGFEITLPVLSRQFHLRAAATYLGQSFGDTKAEWQRQNAFDVCTAPPSSAAGPFSGCLNALYGPPFSPPRLDFLGNPKPGNYNLEAAHPKFSPGQVTASGRGGGFTTHAIGPTVQLDVDVFKRGDLRLSLFLEMRVAWLINQPESILTIRPEYDEGSPLAGQLQPQIFNCTQPYQLANSPYCGYKNTGGEESISFNISPDTFIAQGGGGIRILWSPPW